jgi:xylose isomerase
MAAALGIFGSIDMNRGDYAARLGHRPVPEQRARRWRMALYQILKAGGFTKTGGTQLRRQGAPPVAGSGRPADLAHIGGMDACARALPIA